MQTQLAQEQARSAQKVLEATITQSELEAGSIRTSPIANPDARRHLTEAYRRDHSSSTAFMLARALQPRLAEQAAREHVRAHVVSGVLAERNAAGHD